MNVARAMRHGMFSRCILIIFCLALGGCFGGIFDKPVIQSGPARSGTPVAAPRKTAVAEAEAALNAGQSAKAEQIATRLVSQQLPQGEMGRAAKVLALSASANGHPYLAATALDRWAAAVPGADGTPEWRGVFFAVLKQMPPYEAAAKAREASAPGRPFALRADAAVFTASRQWENRQNVPASMESLHTLYVQTPEKKDRALLERALFTSLRDADSASLALLEPLVTVENAKTFPYAIVTLETLRRKGLQVAFRDEAAREAEALAEGSRLADSSIFRAWDEVEKPTATTVPLVGRTIVLALPLSGQLASIGEKVAQGAEEARKEFANSGHTVGVVTIDTNRAGWVETLAALPESAVIVGGPLRLDALRAAEASGQTGKRVFLTFMPSLANPADEGRAAWRFFHSPEDQLAALFSATRRLEITRYAVMMPDNDPYAAKMADLFTRYVQAGGGEVVKRLVYPSKEPEKWNKLVGSFLGTDKKAENPPATPFRAVFLPDSWQNMELVVPNLFYFLETRQVLLGTALWEQGLAASDHVAAHYYKTALFPGAWNNAAGSQAASQLRASYAAAGKEPDFWAGLGYDFVRFASMLDIQPGWTPASVNAALSRGRGMDWSMAPISWSAEGRASQNLFLFSPVQSGYAPANMPEVEAAYKKAWGIQ